MSGFGDIDEKIRELQENLQKLYILRQLGAEKLVLEKEKEIYQIQKEILAINETMTVDINDVILPKKCIFCDEVPDDEKLACYEEKGRTCKKVAPQNMGTISLQIARLVSMYFVFLMFLLSYLIISNIILNFVSDRLVSFIFSTFCIALVVLFFRKPVKDLFSVLG